MYWSSYSFNYNDIRESIIIENNKLTKKAMSLLRESLILGVEDGSIRDDIDVNYTTFHIINSFQSILGETIITNLSVRNKEKSYFSREKGIINKQYYYKFLELILHGLKP